MNKFVAIAAIVVSALSSVACAADTTPTPGEIIQPVAANGSAFAETSVESASQARPLTQAERMVRGDIESQIRGIYVDRNKVIEGGGKTMALEGKSERGNDAPHEYRGRPVMVRTVVDANPQLERSDFDGLVEDDSRNDLFGPSPK
jgi:hypothetical protein